jgi:hypothetical protein
VEIGDPVTLTLRVTLDENVPPTSPQLEVPPGFSASRVNVQSNFKMTNADFSREFIARWVLVPDVMGTFQIGPPSVDIGGTRVAAPSKLTLKVVAKGQGPPRRKGRHKPKPSFGGMGTFFAPKAPFDLDDPFFVFSRPRKTFSDGRDLKLDRGSDPSVFLYIHADKTNVTVGEQVTLSYWAYFNIDIMGLENYQEPPLAAFTREVLAVPASSRRRSTPTSVGRRLFHAKQYGEVAVFPVRPGKLKTGAWSADVEVLRATGRRQLPRTSNDVVINVTEAPVAGRPLGYRSGTVGRFKMKADLAPRVTYEGDTTSISVQVTGVGKLPSELRVPTRMGVEWLKPERKSGVSMVHGMVGGWRTYHYVVRFTESGAHDLGSIELPYWDPDKRKYEVASAELGIVTVKASADGAAGGKPTPSDGSDQDRDPFEGMSSFRPRLRPFEPDANQGVAPRTLWTWVLAPPIGVAFTSLIAAALRRARRRRSDKKHDPAVLAKVALREAADAQDAKDAAAATERALHLAIEATTGLKSRGMLKDDLSQKLREQLSDDALSDDVIDLFEVCSVVRFEPDGDEEVVERARVRGELVVKALLDR